MSFITSTVGFVANCNWDLLNQIRIAKAKRYVAKQKKGKQIVHMYIEKAHIMPKRKLVLVAIDNKGNNVYIHQ